MKCRSLAFALLLSITLGGCWEKQAAEPPSPHRMTAEDIGRYCGMNLFEHPGPKGQIFAASLIEPVWFSSVRDTIAFTMLPDEPKDIQAIYVSDMGKAPSWDKPGADNWVEARKALFVIGSRAKGGMGGDEAVPFSDRAAAEKFVGENGGRIVTFDQVPRNYVLSSDGAKESTSADDGDARRPPNE
ncbi:Nitrous oxide reductase accessory protein NosL (Required for nitrous oxide reduction) [Bradyrhizobium sp. STM 3843]|uniref:nitrous oxide reductase accessory protein NosL n=1 Tax=Bradyrhizobium sp. STM 3843 TaxID=551947 RepID=UPI000240A512|nr:nitrous oxide reductase accessory protein NosL [Bradyrhizobium sp. STM 3843]CCE06056.1 Nitrous oxide reductase accessory protein NosL (Required for nitrous oxide reduction) [Bradyrhizobium sp. STM 3843]